MYNILNPISPIFGLFVTILGSQLAKILYCKQYLLLEHNEVYDNIIKNR